MALGKLLTFKSGTLAVLYHVMSSVTLLCRDRRFGRALTLVLSAYKAKDVVVCSAGFEYRRGGEEWRGFTELQGYVTFHFRTGLVLYLNVFLCRQSLGSEGECSQNLYSAEER